jgi:simple sugar transport system ATP-binding protein
MTSDQERPLLAMRGIAKAFGGVQALRGVDLELGRGETLALVGDNGAGKSTLMKVLAGVTSPDSGQIELDGTPVHFHGPASARARGVEMIFQDLALFDEADVAWNVFAGRELRRGWVPFRTVNSGAMRRQAAGLLDGLGIDLGPPTTSVGRLSGGQRQMVAIARALAFAQGERILIMDEPTAALGQVESRAVHDLIRTLRSRQGVSIILISHRIPEVLELADRILVLRRGEVVGNERTEDCTVESVVDLIVAGRTTNRPRTPVAGAADDH